MERIWKEVVMAQFHILFHHLLEENSAHDNQSFGQNLYPKPLKYEADMLIT
jgi:hypothetical protein